MIIDTSALLAILRDEPEALSCAEAIADAATRRISAANFLETAIVTDASHDPIASRRVDDLLKVAEITIEPVTVEQAGTGPRSVPRLRQRERAPGATELWRLFRLRAGEGRG